VVSNVLRWSAKGLFVLLLLGRIAGAIALVVAGWLAVIVALTLGSAPGKSMAIVGPPSKALAVIARANGRVLASNDYVTIARSR